MRDWKLENSANGKEISAIPFGTEKRTTSGGSLQFLNEFSGKGACDLAKNPEIQVEGQMERTLLWKIRSEIVEYLPQ